jgi:hypothetical protein
MSNDAIRQKPLVKRRAFAAFTFCALAVVSMTWYSHSLTSGPPSQNKKAPPPSGGSSAGAGNAGSDSALALPVRQWPGKKFIVLDKPKLFRKFGYELYLTKDLSTAVKHIDTSIETDKHHLRYDRCRGKTVTVTEVEPVADEWIVGFSQEGIGPPLYAKTHKGAVEGIAYAEDLDKAAAQWIGRTVYSRRRFIDTYDSGNGTFGTLKVNIQDRLKVTAVRWGTTPLPPKPLWLCVTTKDKEAGFIPLLQSWTNVMTDKISGPSPWAEDIFEKNPQEIYSWDSSTWNAINSHTIVSGMNKEQVRVSWGQPHRIMTDTVKQRCVEQWMYGNQFLCFDHDTVTSIGAR